MALRSMETEPTAGRKRYDPAHKDKWERRPLPVICKNSLYLISKQVSVLKGAPETVRELLSALGLQKYTLGLSLNGWDDLDYFR